MSTSSRIWQELRGELHPETGFIRRRVPMPCEMDVFLALGIPDNRPTLLLETASGSVPPDPGHPSCYGFKFSVTPLMAGHKGRVLMILELSDFQYQDVYAVLVDDVLSYLSNAKDEKSGVRVLMTRLHQWQDFFQEHKTGGLSIQAQQGLYGELWFIRNILWALLEPEIVVASWKGPESANQDFQLSFCAVEVKTSVANPHENTSISNILQLDESSISDLFMVFLALDARHGSGETLPALVKGIRVHLEEKAPNVLSAFNSLLVKAGYMEAHSDQYDTGYNVRYIRFYRVQEGFPRLRVQDIPEGVGDVKYSIAIAACKKFEVTAENFHALLRKG